jgi:WD40 repeat protein
VVAPTRLAQVPGVLIGGVAGLAVGEAVRRLRYVLATHIRQWIVRRSVVGASAISWGRNPPRGAALLRTLPVGGPVARLTPDGRHLLTASAGRATLRDTRSGRLVDRFPWTGPLAVADEMVAQAAGGTVRMRAIGSPGPGGDAAATDMPVGDPAEDQVVGLAFSPDGRLLVSAYAGGEIRVHDVQRRVELWRGETAARTRHVAAGPGGQVAVAGEGRVQLWRQRGVCWEMRHEWTDEPHPKRVAFDAAGARLAVATSDSAVVLRDCASGAELVRLDVRGIVGPVAFHPTDAAVVIAVGDEVRLWHPGAPSRDVRLYPDKGEVLDLDVGRDGQRMVVGCLDVTTVWHWCDQAGETW